MSKTAEEILRKHEPVLFDKDLGVEDMVTVISAMNEHAAQEVAKEVEAYKERVKSEIGDRITNDNHDACAQAFDSGLNTAITLIDTVK